MSRKVTIGVCQLTSTSNKEENRRKAEPLISEAAGKGAKVIFLPEAFDYIGDSKEHTVELAEPLHGNTVEYYLDLAKKFKFWLSLGGFHEKGPETDSKRIYNSHLLLTDTGNIAAVYRKLHLFDVDIGRQATSETDATADQKRNIQTLRESSYTIPGFEMTPPVDSPVGKIGLEICYDLRFPEQSVILAKLGAQILTFPSAFTQTTGKAHWEILLRSRAIENQCYVVAAAQTGKHNSKRSSYGHSLVVDPWGVVLADLGEETGVATVDIDLDYVDKVRSQIPVWNHRRTDIYSELGSRIGSQDITDADTYQFGQVNLQGSQLFYLTSLTMAFVNRKPVLPGHCLISPRRVVSKFSELQPHELSDLFLVVQRVQRALEKEYSVTSSTIAIQDGPEAGQTIKHVHVHIVPRKSGDFKASDDIYPKLEKNDEIPWRDYEDMETEAKLMRKHFH